MKELSELLEIPLPELLEGKEITWDSLFVISAIAMIDEHFGMTMDAKSILNSKTLFDLVNLIKAKKS
jgi:acyl carrier protein